MTADPALDRLLDPPPVPPFGRPFEAVSLDVGGVLVVPDHGMLAHALSRHAIPFDRARFTEGHYRAMAEVDRNRAEPETFADYRRGFLRAVGVPPDQVEAGAAALADVLVPPVWHQPIPGALAAARRLRAAGFRLALTSNADGTVEDGLRRHEVAQLGPGPGVQVDHITDSGVVGKHKPDPAPFLATAAGLGLPPERICHIGDSAAFDAEGAVAVGMLAVHVDPLGWCPGDHAHVASLAAFVDLIAPVTPVAPAAPVAPVGAVARVDAADGADPQPEPAGRDGRPARGVP